MIEFDPDDTQEFGPLDEEGEAPQLAVNALSEVHADVDPKHRRLRALAGPGNPYIFIVASDEGTKIDFSGMDFDELPMVLAELIDVVVGE